jgi:hypothetical protein
VLSPRPFYQDQDQDQGFAVQDQDKAFVVQDQDNFFSPRGASRPRPKSRGLTALTNIIQDLSMELQQPYVTSVSFSLETFSSTLNQCLESSMSALSTEALAHLNPLKHTAVFDIAQSHEVDLFALTETWITSLAL